MKREDFVQKLKSAEVSSDKWQQAMNDRRAEIGAFDDDAPEPTTQPQAVEQTPYEKYGSAGALLPRAMEAKARGANLPTRAIATAGDVLSGLPRLARSVGTGIGTLAGGGSLATAGEEANKELSRINSGKNQNIVEAIGNDPTTWTPGIGQVGKVIGGTAKLGKLAKPIGAATAGAIQGAESATMQQAGEGKIDAGQTAVQTGLGTLMGGGGHYLGKVPGKVISKIKNTLSSKAPGAIEEAANVTAEKTLGISLSKAEQSAPIGSAPKSSFWASVDRALAKVPDIEKIYAGKQQAKEAGFRAATQKTFDAPLNVDDTFSKSLQADIDLRKQTFNNMYNLFDQQGKRAYIDGQTTAQKAVNEISGSERVFDKSGQVATGVKSVSDEAANKISKYIDDLKTIGSDITTNTPEKSGENFSSWSVLRKNIGGEIGRIRSEMSNPMSSANKSQLGSELNAYNSIYKNMKNTERAHMKIIGGDELVKTWDDVNAIFSEGKPITDTLKKLTGYGKEAGEKGSVSVDNAIKNILNPNEFQRLDKAMALMSDETRAALKGVLMGKIFENATDVINVNGIEVVSKISVPKLQRQYQAYGKDMLEKVIGKDGTRAYEDILTTANRANMKQVGLFDTSNPSQSGYGAVLGNLIGATLVGGGMMNQDHTKKGIMTTVGLVLLGMPLAKALARTSLNVGGKQVIKSLPAIGSLGNLTRKLKDERGAVGSADEFAGLQGQKEGLTPAILSPNSGKIYTGVMGHKDIFKRQITKNEPDAEKAVWNEIFKDNTGKYSDYIGFVDKKGNFVSRKQAEENIARPKSLAQMYHGEHGKIGAKNKSGAIPMLAGTAGASGAGLGAIGAYKTKKDKRK